MRFISYEPMLGSLERCTGTYLRRMFKTVNWIIPGPETPNTLPLWSRVQEVEKAADSASMPIYMKHSMSEVYPDLVLRVDFP